MAACKYQMRLIVSVKRCKFTFFLTKKVDRLSNTIKQNVQQEIEFLHADVEWKLDCIDYKKNRKIINGK